MKLTGAAALRQMIERFPDRLDDELGRVVEATTVAVAQRMRATVPVAEGVLRRNITTAVRRLRGRVEIGVDAFYWPWLEYGTVRMAARPFIRPSAELEADPFEQRIRRAAKTLESQWGR